MCFGNRMVDFYFDNKLFFSVCSYYTEGDECDNYPHKSHLPDSFSGKIETLHMINFMCHANLEVSFNKRVTFVTGKNGSGKSAIMAALIVVCGGTACTTGRGVGITGDY